jgi:two-component system, OmpR family, sensor histidine kinase TctE
MNGTVSERRNLSLRRTLLLGILLPMLVFLLGNTVVLYRQALAAADTAYDRTLLATAKSLGEQLEVVAGTSGLQLRATLLYSALEAFEADNRSRLFFRVNGFNGELISGFEDMPRIRQKLPDQHIYAALVHFYDDTYRDVPVRMAVLLQPVASPGGQGMATIQVAETLELRQTLARQILIDTLWRQAGLIAVIALVVVLVVQWATRPVRELSQLLAQRHENDLHPLPLDDAPRELQPLIHATNQHMQRLADLLAHQKRFVRDTSHQLRTPLAVLKAQVQSARRGDIEPRQALEEIAHTVDDATELANQMLALAKVEQLSHDQDVPIHDWADIVRQVALDLAPLMAQRELDFSIDTQPAPVRSHVWALRELSRNLLHNAIGHSPEGGRLSVQVTVDGGMAVLNIADNGPGISDNLRQRLFQPFATERLSAVHQGTGLGLTICAGIAQSLGGRIDLTNRVEASRIAGLDAVVCLPLAPSNDIQPSHETAGTDTVRT